MPELQPLLSTSVGQCSWSQVKDGCQVSVTPGPSFGLALRQPKDRLWALVVNICSRDCTICPRLASSPPVSDQLQSPRCGPEQSWRGREHGQSRTELCFTCGEINSLPAHVDSCLTIELQRAKRLKTVFFCTKVNHPCVNRVRCKYKYLEYQLGKRWKTFYCLNIMILANEQQSLDTVYISQYSSFSQMWD